MKIKEDGILKAALAALVLVIANGSSAAPPNVELASLRGVESMTVHADCCEGAEELGLVEDDIRRSIQKQLENAGVKVRPPQMWMAVPGRCRLRAQIKVYRPAEEEIFIYSLKVDFLQTVTLTRGPQTQMDVATWELTWFAHGSRDRLAETIRQNLEVLARSFIADFRRANPPGKMPAGFRGNRRTSRAPGRLAGSNPPVTTGKPGFTGSKDSDVFHDSACRLAGNISAGNLVTYKSRQEAVKAGKRPCKRCNP